MSLGGKMGNSPVINVLGGIRVQTSLQGVPKQIVYGRTRISGNLVWYGDFKSVPASSGKKGSTTGAGTGKKGGGQYDYGAAVIIGLCQGPVSRIGQIWSTQGNLSVNTAQETYVVPPGGGSYTATQAATYLSDLGVTRGDTYTVTANDYGSPGSITLTGTQQTPMIFGSTATGHYTRSGTHSATYNFGAGDAGKTMTINYTYAPPITGGGVPQDPITSIGFTFFNGALGQSVWSYLSSNHPSQAIPYSGLAFVATEEFDLGMSGTLPNLSFEVYGILPFGSGVGDSNPADVLYDLLTNAIYGCGIDSSFIGSMTQYSNYCVANGLLASPALDTARTAADYIKDILEATNSEIIETGGTLLVVPYGDTTVVANGATFQPATQPIYDLNADDFIRSGLSAAVQVERPTIQDAYNSVTIEFLDRGNSYNPSVVQAQDLNAIQNYKYRPEGTRQYHMFTTQAAASKCAATVLSRMVYIRNTFKFKIPAKYILLDPMDLITVTVPELGLNLSPVRILTIDEQADRTLDITAEEFPWGCSGPTLYPKQDQTPGGPNASAPPGAVNTPIIFEALSRLNNQIGHTVWFGLSGANPNWGGARIWVSLDGTTYKQAGTAIGRCKMGALTAGLASHADPDTVDTLSVDLTESLGALDSFTSAETNVFAPLCYVGAAGVGELIAYEIATLTSAYNYDCATLLRRGVYGSTIASHSIGDDFLFLDEVVEGWDYDVGLIGATVHFKFTSFNQSGLVEENLADVTDYPYTITGACTGLLTPAHASYRPLTNPLTAHDAGASATINIAAFNMIVPGQANVALGSGAITGLLHNTIYYVYFSDPGFLPLSAPTYLASATKTDAIDEAGFMFVGSITTPMVGAPDTSGNNDGGGGAQLGSTTIIGSATTSTTGTTGSANVANPHNALGNGEASTYADMTAPGNSGSNFAYLTLSGFPSITSGQYKSLILVMDVEGINTATPDASPYPVTESVWQVSVPPAAGNPFIFNLNAQCNFPRQLFTATLPANINLSQMIVQFQIATGMGNTSGTLELKVWRTYVLGIT